MEEDLDLGRSNRYQWLLNIFYIAYIVFEFQALMWKIISPNIWATIVIFGWGLVATLQASAQKWASMMACRWFLGGFAGRAIVVALLTRSRVVRGRVWSRDTVLIIVLLSSL